MINASTKTTFPSGSIFERSKIIYTEKIKEDSEKTIIFTEKSPFHPLDYSWPDQPQDRGFININNKDIKLKDCLTAAFEKAAKKIFLDKNISFKRGDENCFFLIAHIVDTKDVEDIDLIGKEVDLKVDEKYRTNLSQAHTATHIMALALNKVSNKFWKKEFRRDSLKNFDLDSIAIQSSKIEKNNEISAKIKKEESDIIIKTIFIKN